jgi:hypothetical protein
MGDLLNSPPASGIRFDLNIFIIVVRLAQSISFSSRCLGSKSHQLCQFQRNTTPPENAIAHPREAGDGLSPVARLPPSSRHAISARDICQKCPGCQADAPNNTTMMRFSAFEKFSAWL